MKISLIAVASTLLFAAPAWADEADDAAPLEADQIVVTGTKFSGDFGGKSGIPIDRVPQSVQIVGAEDIVAQGAGSIGDLLRGCVGHAWRRRRQRPLDGCTRHHVDFVEFGIF